VRCTQQSVRQVTYPVREPDRLASTDVSGLLEGLASMSLTLGYGIVCAEEDSLHDVLATISKASTSKSACPMGTGHCGTGSEFRDDRDVGIRVA
jgi:hypothetical protein